MPQNNVGEELSRNEAARRASVESLLLPGTPQAIAERYATLEERAHAADFGALEDGLVVLDTETTGLSFRDCELIEIAAARINGRQVVERFQTFIQPRTPIPPEITALTHISMADVAGAPSAEEAVAQLADFVGGMPILAHNATFDRTFVEKVRGGCDVSDNWIDTLALSRIALPRLSSHRLSDMAQAFGCDSVTHRAMDDVEALCGMWRIMLLGLMDMPQGLLAMLSDMHAEVEWPFRPIFSYIAREMQEDYLAKGVDEPFSLKQIRYDLVKANPTHMRDDAAEKDVPLRVVGKSQLEKDFSDSGVLSSMYENFEPRPEQLQMSLEVRRALETSTHRALEAGTGVGKSVAYLLPEVLFARENNVTVGVATKTNALTDQLVSHELPALAEALPGGVTFASLKGYDHYPCLYRMDAAARDEWGPDMAGEGGAGAFSEAEALTALAVSYAYVCQSPEGDLDALGIRWRVVPQQMLTITPRECPRTKCPYYPNECLLHGARRRAASSDVVVTNHSLLLRDVSVEGRILPPIRHWVIDEAHAFEGEARRQWAFEVTGDKASDGFKRLGTSKTGVIHSVMTQSSNLEGATLLNRLLVKTSASAARAAITVSDVFLALHDLAHVAGNAGGYDSQVLWIDESVRATPEWAALSEVSDLAIRRLDEAAKDVTETAQTLAEVSPQLASELLDAGTFLSDLHAGLRLIMDGADESYVYSAQVSRRKRDIGSERLVAEKIDVGGDLGKLWLPEMMSVVFTSATMAVGESFEHFNHGVGLDTLDPTMHRDVRLESSFDYDNNMSVIVTKDMPAPNDPRYLDALTDMLYDVHVAMGGSVLTLFTNRRDMERVYEALQPRLARAGLELLQQERGSSPRRLRGSFMADKSRSLLALKSFWEGFDASGDTLRCVVIPKLPFASPRDPLVRERERREDRAWWRYSLPEAVIEVKQAAGRLIRSATDSGVLVLADSRLATKRYGRQFTNSLPNPHASQLECENVGRYITMWRASHER